MTHRLLINDVETDILDFRVEHGEKHFLTFTLPYDKAISNGDTVEVQVDGVAVFKGECQIIKKNRRLGVKNVTVKGKTRILYDKLCRDASYIDYLAQDAGAIVKDLIDHYFAGTLTANNVDTSTGVTIDHFNCENMSVGEAIEDMNLRADTACYVDADDDVHYFVKGSIHAKEKIEQGDAYDVEEISDAATQIGTIIIEGATVIASAGSGMPERLYRSGRINNDDEAQAVADAIYALYGDEQRQVKVVVNGFYDVNFGEAITANLPADEIENEEFDIQSPVMWEFSVAAVRTTLSLGAKSLDVSAIIERTLDYLQKPGAGEDSDVFDGSRGVQYAEICEVTDWQANAATGTAANPQNTNDNNVATAVDFTAPGVGAYAQVDLGHPFACREFRYYMGGNTPGTNGSFRVEYYRHIDGTWQSWSDHYAFTNALAWSAWITPDKGPIIAQFLRVIYTFAGGFGATDHELREVEVRT